MADLLIGPSGAKHERDNWQKSAHRLLVGLILHVLHAEPIKSPTGVLRFITDPSRTQFEIRDGGSPPGTCHRDLIRRWRVSRARCLTRRRRSYPASSPPLWQAVGLYDDPIIARNTVESDFRIADLMNADRSRPTSLLSLKTVK